MLNRTRLDCTLMALPNGMFIRTQLGENFKGHSRNKPCSCGSMKKYKNCCINLDEKAQLMLKRLKRRQGKKIAKLIKRKMKEENARRS